MPALPVRIREAGLVAGATSDWTLGTGGPPSYFPGMAAPSFLGSEAP